MFSWNRVTLDRFTLLVCVFELHHSKNDRLDLQITSPKLTLTFKGRCIEKFDCFALNVITRDR